MRPRVFALLVLLVTATVGLAAATVFETIYQFPDKTSGPLTPLTEGPDGTLFGVIASTPGGEAATIYRLAGTRFARVYALTAAQGTFSANALVVADDGGLYGTTAAVSVAPDVGAPPVVGGGSIFRIDPATGALTGARTFTRAEGTPSGPFLQGADGNFYGVLVYPELRSAVYRMTREGDLSILRAFPFTTDGTPNTLIQASDGVLYGTTTAGGSEAVGGTLFRIGPSGEYRLLHAFQKTSSTDGADPVAVAAMPDGSLYGVTSGGGGPDFTALSNLTPPPSFGTVFRMTAEGRYSVVHRFMWSDGANPAPGLVRAADGSVYGATSRGGSLMGTVFRIDRSGRFAMVESLPEPVSFLRLSAGRDGAVYGVRGGPLVPLSATTLFKVVTR